MPTLTLIYASTPASSLINAIFAIKVFRKKATWRSTDAYTPVSGLSCANNAELPSYEGQKWHSITGLSIRENDLINVLIVPKAFKGMIFSYHFMRIMINR